jgi:hypothetical protein
MKRAILAVLGSLALTLGLAVVIPAPAQAATYACYYRYDTDVHVQGNRYLTITGRVCSYDYGTYERLQNIRFTWPYGTADIRRLYSSSGRTIAVRCGSATTYTTVGTGSYYNGSVYSMGNRYCPEPARVRVFLNVDTVNTFDTTTGMDWTL